MTLRKSDVDAFLIDWEEGEYRAEVKTLALRSRSLSFAEVGPIGVSVSKKAQIIRDRLSRTVKRVPEVVVKISNNPCHGMRQIRQYVGYISRRGLLEIEDQNGDLIRGKREQGDLLEEWRHNGLVVLPEAHARRETLNLILSMPALTDEVALKRAVRTFAATEFSEHSYVFAYHTPSTDPDPEPPAHPHVHLVVKMEDFKGRRLNPRKADLRRWRETFAEALRANGIEANATSRLARIQHQRPERRAWSSIASSDRTTGSEYKEPTARARALEEKRLSYYYALGRALGESELKSDRDLAGQIVQFIQESLSRQGRPRRSDPSPESGVNRDRE